MILAIFSEDFSPLNAASSILLNRHSLFVVLIIHLQAVVHTQCLYLQEQCLVQMLLVFSYLVESNDFLRPFFFGLKASGPAILKSFTHLVRSAGLLMPCDKANF